MSSKPQQEVKKINAIFNSMDKNHDGKVEYDELLAFHQMCGVKEDSTKELFTKLDTDHSGYVELGELIEYLPVSEKTKELWLSFKDIDENADGGISYEEMKFMFEKKGEVMTEDELREIFQTADTNNDGTVSFLEFVNVVMSEEDLNEEEE